MRSAMVLMVVLAVSVFAVDAKAGGCGTCPGKKMKSGCSAASACPAMTSKDIVDTAVAAGSFNTLVTAVKAANLVDTLKGEGPFTVFAPTDAAFAALPEGTIPALLKDKAALTGVLTYHVVPGRLTAAQVLEAGWLKTVNGQSLRVSMSGDEARVDGARIIKTDIATSNGIIHVIDAVVTPRKDIVDTAVKAGTFNTLLAAAKAAGLAKTLKSDGPFTVFAPADSAFAKLPAGTVEALLKNPEKLAAILKYHVVPGRVLSGDLKIGTTEAKTAQGGSLRIERTRDGKVTVNGAKVTAANVIAGNGVIHIVDTVILPQ